MFLLFNSTFPCIHFSCCHLVLYAFSQFWSLLFALMMIQNISFTSCFLPAFSFFKMHLVIALISIHHWTLLNILCLFFPTWMKVSLNALSTFVYVCYLKSVESFHIISVTIAALQLAEHPLEDHTHSTLTDSTYARWNGKFQKSTSITFIQEKFPVRKTFWKKRSSMREKNLSL